MLFGYARSCGKRQYSTWPSTLGVFYRLGLVLGSSALKQDTNVNFYLWKQQMQLFSAFDSQVILDDKQLRT